MIKFNYNGVDYELTFTRDVVAAQERKGFKFDEVADRPVSGCEDLFKIAFLANHNKTKEATINDIYEHFPNKKDLFTALIEMYVDTVKTLFNDETDEEEDEKNVKWTLE